jgi:UDP-glucose 4-epimerase
MSLLITGASGHIASTVAYNCNKKKIKTILLTRSEKKYKILKKKFKNCKINFLKDLKKIRNQDIKTILHTASLNDKETNNQKNSLKNSLNITKNIFSQLNINKVKKIIYLSTAQVYGSNLNLNVNEKTKLKPINNYGLSRIENEVYLKKLAKKHDIKLIILRISNVVGDPYIKDNKCLRLLPNDIKNQAQKFNSITLRSSGLQSRNFISLKTTAAYIEKLIKLKMKKKFMIFNLGGINTQVIALVKKFIILYEKKKKRKILLIIKSNEPKKVKKLYYQDFYIRKTLKIKKKESLHYIAKNLLNS